MRRKTLHEFLNNTEDVLVIRYQFVLILIISVLKLGQFYKELVDPPVLIMLCNYDLLISC